MDAVEHLDKSLVGERVVCLMLGEHSAARANRNTDSLTWLLLSPILYKQVIVRLRPSFPLEVSRLEDALIKKHKVTTACYDVMQLLVKIYSLILELFDPLFLLRRDVTDLYFLQSEACLLHYLEHSTRLDTSFWILAMKHHTTLWDTKHCPQSKIVLIGNELNLIIRDIC